jgi:gamma-glutamylcyclotransferase
MYPMTFSYGSNLEVRQMRRRCPGAVRLERATLRGYRLAFRGYSRTWNGAVATLVPDARGVVHGVLYRLPPRDLARLDQFEGHPRAYQRVRVSLRDQAGRRRRAQVYLMPPNRKPGAPGVQYLVMILRAYAALGFDRTPVLRAAFPEVIQ